MISIIITVFNNDIYLEECLNSILDSCSGVEFEILIGVDNCKKSLDFLIKKYETLNDKIKIFFFKEKVGTYIIRNSLACKTKFDKIVFFDSDDVMSKNTIPFVLKGLSHNEFVRFAFLNFYGVFKLDKNNEVKNLTSYAAGAFAIKKETFMSMNGFEPWVCAADGEFIWRLESLKKQIINSNFVNVFYRRHQNNLTTSTETSMSSPLRRQYHEMKYNKIKNNINYLPNTLSVSGCIEITKFVYDRFKHNFESFYSEFSEPIMSIIIPTYNNPEFLKDCLESTLESTNKLHDVEILVGIDGCQKTLDYVKNNNFDKKIRFYYFDINVGPYIIKNTLSKISESEKLFFFDSDDIMEENLLITLNEKLDNYDCVKPNYFNFQNVFKNKESLMKKKSSHFGEGVFAIKKNIFLHLNGFEGWRCAADSDFMARLQMNRIKILQSTESIFFRRMHSNSLTHSRETGWGSKKREEYIQISKSKKSWGPLPELVIKNCFQVINGDLFELSIPKTTYLNASKNSNEEMDIKKKLILEGFKKKSNILTEKEKQEIIQKRKENLMRLNSSPLQSVPKRIKGVKPIVGRPGIRGRNNFNP